MLEGGEQKKNKPPKNGETYTGFEFNTPYGAWQRKFDTENA